MNSDIAVEQTAVTTSIQGLLTTGGPVVWILCGFSLVALTIVLAKMWQLVALRAESATSINLALEQWRAGNGETALSQLDVAHPVAAVVKYAMEGRLEGARDSLLREEVERIASVRMNDLRSFFRPLELIGALSPLLGLLGTVIGMIVAFQQMEAAGSQVNPSVLSGGIWQALLTTAVGMAVAIPVVAVHAWLERKTERVAALMSDSVTRVFTAPLQSTDNWPPAAAKGVVMQLEAGKRRRVLQVSLTPLIDVVFILLLFFLLSSTFTQWRELNVVTPGETVNNEPKTLLKVQLISSQGEIRVEDQHYASANAAGLRALVLANPNTVFALDAEDGLNTQAMITLADRLQQAGARHVSLAGITR